MNPVLRRRRNREGRVWIENEEALAIVDVANACYQTMLRLLAYAYSVTSAERRRRRSPSISPSALMQAMTLLGGAAARLPAGTVQRGCNAGMSLHRAARRFASFPRRQRAALFRRAHGRAPRQRALARQ